MHALAGDLEVLGLDEVLSLLTVTGRTGCVRLEGRGGQGYVWVADGAVVAATRDQAPRAPADEVLCALLGEVRGTFTFDADDPPPPPGDAGVDTCGAGDLLDRARSLVDEWRRLHDAIPSLDARIRLVEEIPADAQRTITARHWPVLATIGPGRSVGALATSLGASELTVLRLAHDLMASGLVELLPPRSALRRAGPIPPRGRQRPT